MEGALCVTCETRRELKLGTHCGLLREFVSSLRMVGPFPTINTLNLLLGNGQNLTSVGWITFPHLLILGRVLNYGNIWEPWQFGTTVWSRKNVKSINEKACKSWPSPSYLQVFDGLLLKMDFGFWIEASISKYPLCYLNITLTSITFLVLIYPFLLQTYSSRQEDTIICTKIPIWYQITYLESKKISLAIFAFNKL